MSLENSKLMLNPNLTVLLIILIVLLIYCSLYHFVYKSQTLTFDYDNSYGISYDKSYDKTYNNNKPLNQYVIKNEKHKKILNENIELLDIIIEKNKSKLKENFYNITQAELQQNINELNTVSQYIKNIQNNDIAYLQNIIKQVRKQSNIDKQQILDLLTSIYMIHYIEVINKQNASSYREFMKYQNPKENKYYSQYT